MFNADQKKLEGIVNFAKENMSFMPEDLIWAFSSMKNRGVEYNPGLYRISLRDMSSQIDIRMAIKNPLKLDLIYHSLSGSQKKNLGLSDKSKMRDD